MKKNEENSVWYGIGILDDTSEILNKLSTIKGYQTVLNYYKELSDSENHPLISAMTAQGVHMKEDDVKKYFGTKDYRKSLHENHPEFSFLAYFGEEGCSVVDLKSAQLDFRAYQLFGLRTEEGEGFTRENTTIRQASDDIPVILGHEYKGIIPVGQKLVFAIGFVFLSGAAFFVL